MKKEVIHGLILFLGLYFITVSLFYYETGSIVTGLIFGVLSALLKTLWVKVHQKLFGVKELPKNESELITGLLYLAMRRKR